MKELSLNALIQRRRVVIHHTHLLPSSWSSLLKPEDIVFFDDCLFSQWTFLKEHACVFAERGIDCVLGFSSGLYASEDTSQQIHDVQSHVLHDACNIKIQTLANADCLRDTLPEMRGFMKVSQLKDLLKLPFCHLALHGCCHLNLQLEHSVLKRLQTFKHDLDTGCQRLAELDLASSTYVYPYVHSFTASDIVVKHAGFTEIVGGNTAQIFRISIEDLIADKNYKCCS